MLGSSRSQPTAGEFLFYLYKEKEWDAELVTSQQSAVGMRERTGVVKASSAWFISGISGLLGTPQLLIDLLSLLIRSIYQFNNANTHSTPNFNILIVYSLEESAKSSGCTFRLEVVVSRPWVVYFLAPVAGAATAIWGTHGESVLPRAFADRLFQLLSPQ